MKACMLGLTAAAALATAAFGQVTISQIYGGGGNSGGLYSRDFVELHNNDPANPADISGWSIQYAGTASAFGGTNTKVDIPSGATIPPGGYYLIALAVGANSGQPALPTPDLDTPPGSGSGGAGTIAVGSTGGKLALVNSTTPVSAVTCPTDASIVDFIGYGAANCSEGSPCGATANATAVHRNTNGCTDTNNNLADCAIASPNPRNSLVTFLCPGFADCNNNGVPDATDISSGSSQDCNADNVPDECQLAGNDCNANGVLDVCEIAGNDCNNNGRLDSCDLATGTLTDANNNGTPDACEGAIVVNCNANVTVLPAGIRAGGNGTAFFNIEGTNNGANASYGGLRWDTAAAVSAFDTLYGAGNWQITEAYLHLVQSNAAFTFDGPVDMFYTDNDAQDFTVPGANPPNPNTTMGNFGTDYSDRLTVTRYEFVRGTGPNGGNGTREAYLLYNIAASNNPAQAAIGAELDSASGSLTLILHPAFTAQFPDGDPFTAATYAGRTHSTFRGPALVLWAEPTGGGGCDPDYDQNGVADQDDVTLLINIIATGDASQSPLDADFDCNGVADQDDVTALIDFIASGGASGCHC